MATWYGPGFYGRRTACGVKMSRTLLGVAHKTLPCGTQVAVLYKGRRITVPVVDRGPFRARHRATTSRPRPRRRSGSSTPTASAPSACRTAP